MALQKRDTLSVASQQTFDFLVLAESYSFAVGTKDVTTLTKKPAIAGGLPSRQTAFGKLTRRKSHPAGRVRR